MPITWSGDAKTIDIEGTARELLNFAERMQQCSFVQPVSMVQSDRDGAEGAYLPALIVRLDVGLVDVSIADNTLVIAGSTEALSTLALHVRSLAETAEPQSSGRLRPHSHIEYYPGHFFLKPNAIPLIFTLRQGLTKWSFCEEVPAKRGFPETTGSKLVDNATLREL